MALPGFTAEASVGPATQKYRATVYYAFAAMEHLIPQADELDFDDAEVGDEDAEDETEMEAEDEIAGEQA